MFYFRIKEADMNISFRKGKSITSLLKGVAVRRGLAWGIIIIVALLAFEIFNFSTTQFALSDVLGNLTFAGLPWATILAIAFCGIDFAGIARLFTPEDGQQDPSEVWYLFGAWLLAAAMNATLTWWGVSVAISSHANLSSTVISAGVLTKVVPVFVAVMVWLIRVLVIGTFSVAGNRLFSQAQAPVIHSRPASALAATRSSLPTPPPFRPLPKVARPEPSYHNVSMNARPAREAEYVEPSRQS